LFGGAPVHYYRHIRKMVRNNHTAIKFDASNTRYAALPDDYLAYAAEIATPMLLIQGQDNRVFADSNIQCHARLEKNRPRPASIAHIPRVRPSGCFHGKKRAC
jgi:cholesterol oxidase